MENRNKNFIKTCILILILGGAVWYVHGKFSTWSKEKKEEMNTLVKAYEILQPKKNLTKRSGNRAELRINEFHMISNKLKTDLENIKAEVGITKPLTAYSIPEITWVKSIDDIKSAWSVIYEKARDDLSQAMYNPEIDGSLIPEDLGMKAALFDDKEVIRTLQYQLSLLDEFSRLAKNAGIQKIDSIRYLKPSLTGAGNFIKEYPVSFDLQCNLRALIALLHTLRNTSKAEAETFARFFIVRNLTIKSMNPEETDPDKQMLKTNITVAVMKFVTKEERAVIKDIREPLDTPKVKHIKKNYW
jgi:hypothetical protein